MNEEMNEMMNEYSVPQFRQDKKYFSKLGFRYFLSTVIIFGAQLGVLKLVSLLNPDFAKENNFLIAMLGMYLVGMPIVFFMITRIKPQKKMEKKSFTGKQLLTAFLISYATMYLSNLLGMIFISMITAIKGNAVTNAMSEVATANNPLINIVIMVIGAPIFEEILFRKILLERTVKYGEKLAILLSGLFFGLYHGNLYQFFYAFSLGCIFAYIFCKTGKLIYTIVLHMIINFLGSVVAVQVVKLSHFNEISQSLTDTSLSPEEMLKVISDNLMGLSIFFVYAILLLVCVLIGVILFFMNLKKYSFEPAEYELEKGTVFKTVFLNVGMIIFMLFWIGYIIFATVI